MYGTALRFLHVYTYGYYCTLYVPLVQHANFPPEKGKILETRETNFNPQFVFLTFKKSTNLPMQTVSLSLSLSLCIGLIKASEEMF